MSVTKANLPGWVDQKDITATLGAGSLTITTALVYKVGSDTIFEFDMSDSSVLYIKVGKAGRVKVGGSSNQFDTGTEIVWQS